MAFDDHRAASRRSLDPTPPISVAVREPIDTLAIRSFAFEQFSAAAAILDSTGCIIDVNEAWRLFASLNDGPTDTTGCGVNYLDVCDSSAADGHADARRVASGLRGLLSGEHCHFDLEYPCPSPEQDRWFLLRASSAPVEHGAGIVLFHIDVTARRLVENRLAVLADVDELTALPNRPSAVRFLGARLTPTLRLALPVGAIRFALDGLESVNDTYGQCVGDEMLVQAATRAQRSARDTDLLCRLGGSEFLLIVPDMQADGAEAIAQRLRAVMAEPFQIGSVRVRSGASVGTAFSASNSTVGSLLGAAGTSMHLDRYRRKASGDVEMMPRPEFVDPIDEADRPARHDVTVAQLVAGMVIESEVHTMCGNLLLSAGAEVTETILHRIRNFASTQGVIEPIPVSVRHTRTPT